MTALIGEQITRIRRLVQDTDESAFSSTKVLTQHQDELSRIAREMRLGDIEILLGVQNQALYSLSTANVAPTMVLYNEHRLNFVTEEFLDRNHPLWEFQTPTDPLYWSTDNQDPNTIRLTPSPQRNGSNIPVIPPAPFIRSAIDNLVVFFYRDFADLADDDSDEFPLLDIWEDVMVWRTAAELARREGPYQNLPLVQTASALAEMWLGFIES